VNVTALFAELTILSLGNKSSAPVFEDLDACTLATQSGTTVDGPTFCSLIVHGPVPPASLLDRTVIGAASWRIGNESYKLIREHVQPYNFSFNPPDLISFLTPRMDDATKHANLTLRTADGRIAFLNDVLLVTEGCTGLGGSGIGWLGSGLECRPCPTGAHISPLPCPRCLAEKVWCSVQVVTERTPHLPSAQLSLAALSAAPAMPILTRCLLTLTLPLKCCPISAPE
jgi:hypothetical protein